MPRFVKKAQSIPIETSTLAKKLDENRIYMFSNLPAFFEENDIEQETMNRTILSVKEHLKFLKKKFQDIYLTHHLPLLEARSPSKLKMFLRMHKKSSLNSLVAMQQKLIFRLCQ